MKRKSIILLSSILAGSLLVGGTFAAYAVTDNADPFGINVTPGNLDEDDTKYVTLEWGQGTSLEGVGLLKVGENRKVGVVNLVSSRAYEGVFSFTIRDDTATKESGQDYMFNHLKVSVYSGEKNLDGTALPSEGLVKTILPTAEPKDVGGKNTKTNSFVAASSKDGAKYTVFVTLEDTASPTFNQMSKDKVHLSVDWGKNSEDEVADGTMAYYKKPVGWTKLYAFTWKGDKVNSAYPGVEMVKLYDDIYQILVPDGKNDNIIFNNGGQGTGNQTDDISMLSTAEYGADKTYDANDRPYWNGTYWASKPPKVEQLEITAYKTVGEIRTEVPLTDVKPGTDTENQHIYKITLAVGDKVTFNYGLENIHFYHFDTEQGKPVDDGITFVATAAGEHTFYYNNAGEMYVGVPVADASYYLVGTHNDWTQNAASKMTKDSENANHYYVESVTFKAGEKIKVTDSKNWWNNATTYEDCGYTISEDADRNVVVTTAGTYRVNLWLDSGNSNYITIESPLP